LDDNGEIIKGKEAEYKKHMILYEESLEEDRKKKLAENADEVNAVLNDFAAMIESFIADGELSENEIKALKNV
jgi:hypothetical protein